MAQENSYVSLKHVNKYFGDFQASKDISFDVKKGKLVALLGPSGSGKTTILRILAGLESADSGEVYIDGQDVTGVAASKRGIGFVFQNYALFRYKTVYENVAYGLKLQKWKKEDIKARVTEMLKLVGLEGVENRYPRQLSGGQRQRVAFARALAPQPHILLLDEPFAAIDAKVRKELRSWLKELIETVGITSIFVTHDQEEAIEVADEIIVTNHGQIEQIGEPIELYQNPKTAFVAQFIGESVTVDHFGGYKGFEQLAPEQEVIIRPEYITLQKKSEELLYPVTTETGIVEQVTFQGNVIAVCVRVREKKFVAYRQVTQELVQKGEKVNVFFSRVYVKTGDTVTLVRNSALTKEESIYI